ncbi:MAG: hypothetical protein M3N53_08615 [Actinomycetota bacterium]|nr:hypothetical protein [Actinomycetota bacterium]
MRRSSTGTLCAVVITALNVSSAAAQQVATCMGQEATIVGTDGPDEIVGTQYSDVIVGLGGDDVITDVSTEWDLVCGDAGDDRISGAGIQAVGGDGSDTFDSVTEVDYTGAPGPVHVDLAAGVAEGEGTDVFINVAAVAGSAYDDTLLGDEGPNYLRGGWADGPGGDDIIDGRGGNDAMDAEGGADSLFGGSGDDAVCGLLGVGEMSGGDGDDHLGLSSTGRSGGAPIDGGEGLDAIYLASGTVQRCWSAGTGAASVDLQQGTITTGLEWGDPSSYALVGVENVVGSGRADILIGDDGPNLLVGNGKGDIIDGGAGDDDLRGRSGPDEIAGGAGSDRLSGHTGYDGLEGGEGADVASGGRHDDRCDAEETRGCERSL